MTTVIDYFKLILFDNKDLNKKEILSNNEWYRIEEQIKKRIHKPAHTHTPPHHTYKEAVHIVRLFF